MSLLHLAIGILATWRVTHLLHAENGPWDLSVRLRKAVGDGFWARVLDCFYCLSLWVAAPVAVVLASSWTERALLWLALSGGACIAQRLLPPEVTFHEEAPATTRAPSEE